MIARTRYIDDMLREALQNGVEQVVTYIDRAMLERPTAFHGADATLAIVKKEGEPYTWGAHPSELPRYLAVRGLAPVEDVDATTYRKRYLAPLGRGDEALSEFRRAALVDVAR